HTRMAVEVFCGWLEWLVGLGVDEDLRPTSSRRFTRYRREEGPSRHENIQKDQDPRIQQTLADPRHHRETSPRPSGQTTDSLRHRTENTRNYRDRGSNPNRPIEKEAQVRSQRKQLQVSPFTKQPRKLRANRWC